MNRRHEDADTGDITGQLKPLTDDDVFLTQLSRGTDPSDGSDELAGLLLTLRDDIERPLPPAPVIEGADEDAVVIPLAGRRGNGRSRPLVSGLIGAAAATLVIAGSGAAIYSATPGSPLWGVSSALFSDRAAVVELAGTLEEMDSRASEGDMDGTRVLLEEARKLVRDIEESDTRSDEGSSTPVESTVTTTVTTTVTRPGETSTQETAEPSPEPTPAPARETATATATETVRETVTETSVVSVTVTRPAAPVIQLPAPAPAPEPVPVPTDLVPVLPTPTLEAPQIPVPDLN